jgi:signal transduction histidine kinase
VTGRLRTGLVPFLSRRASADGSVRRIALAILFTVVLIAAALAVTIWGYSGAVHARERSQSASRENAIAARAETYLWREREAMNEYLLAPDAEINREVQSLHERFDDAISELERGDHGRRKLTAAKKANHEFIETFQSNLDVHPGDQAAERRLVLLLNGGEEAVLAPLHTLKQLNLRKAERREAQADARSREALLGAISAGLLAILAFAWYVLRLVRRVDRQNDTLRQVDRMKDDFIASVSHELRTPLTSIIGYLEVVLAGDEGELTEGQERSLTVVSRNGERLLRLVGDLLFVAQLDDSRVALEKAHVDLAALARRCLEAARPVAEQRSVELTLESQEFVPLEGDPGRLTQVIDNLLSNALKFTPPGGRVEVRLAVEGEAVHLEIADTGMGVSSADQKHLFERFFRSSEATTKAIQGTGLGLSIVAALVEAHGGSIEVESEIGVGTTFRIVLPMSKAAELVAA